MCSKIGNVSEGSPNVVDLIRAGKVDLIINTPRSRAGVEGWLRDRACCCRFWCAVHHNDSRLAVAAGDAITVAAEKDGIGVESIRELCYP